MTQPDLFGQTEKSPSVSFKNAVPGTRVTIKLTAYPEEQQARNFDSGKLEFWDDGSPKKIILVKGTVNGAPHALWVNKGTAMFAAIQTAQKEAGTQLAPGGDLTVEFTHEVPSSKGAHFHPAKQYKATYVPGSVFNATPAAPVHTATNPPVTASATPAPQGAPAGLSPEMLAALANLGVTNLPG